MQPEPPIQVFYNSACPVCDAGIREQRTRMAVCRVNWVDVHEQPQAVQALAAPLETVRERLHVIDADGRLQVGADALATLWLATPGQRWLGRLTRFAPVRALARVAYNAFARMLYRWNRWRNHW
jgi:predicted DCC family thiol-disulfide oxidoreductase YuxK